MWLSAFVPTFFLQVLETSPCRGGGAEIFDFSLHFRFLSCHSRAISSPFSTALAKGRHRTMLEGRRRRTSGHPQLEHHRDHTLRHPNPPSCREPPAESFLCIALVNLELCVLLNVWFVIYCGFQTYLVVYDILMLFVVSIHICFVCHKEKPKKSFPE
jgi:hypothetical protein